MGYHVFLTNKEWEAGVAYNPNQNGVKGILDDGLSPKQERGDKDFEGLARTNEYRPPHPFPGL